VTRQVTQVSKIVGSSEAETVGEVANAIIPVICYSHDLACRLIPSYQDQTVRFLHPWPAEPSISTDTMPVGASSPLRCRYHELPPSSAGIWSQVRPPPVCSTRRWWKCAETSMSARPDRCRP